MTKLRSALAMAQLPALYTFEDRSREETPVAVKLFMLGSGATWLITEACAQITNGDGYPEYLPLTRLSATVADDVIMFGYADLSGFGQDAELGYVSLNELEAIKMGSIPAVELDAWFKPKSLAALIDERGAIVA